MIRLGIVPYLNARPLLTRAAGVRFVRRPPVALVGALAAGRIDAGLLPSLAYARHPEWVLVGRVGIASRGPVGSVRLFCRVPLARVRRLAVDPDSVTSVALLRILCVRRFHVRPRFVSDAVGADAALWIGDRGLREPRRPPAAVIDLGEAWTDWTGLPFVYAAWMAQPARVTPGLLRSLSRAPSRADRLRAAAAAARRFPLAPAALARYLTRRIRYRLGPAERQGLARFYAEAARVGVIARAPEVRFAGEERTHEVG